MPGTNIDTGSADDAVWVGLDMVKIPSGSHTLAGALDQIH